MAIGAHSQATFVFGDTKFSVVYAARAERKAMRSEKHSHTQYELHIFNVGGGYINGCGRTIKFAKNTAVLIPPGTDHEVFSDPDDLPIVMGVTFSFKKAPSSSRADAKLFSYFSKYMPAEGEIAVLKDKFFTDFARKFMEESESDPALASALIINMLEGLFLNIIRLLSKPRTSERVPLSSYRTTSIANDAALARNFEDYLSMPGCTLTSLAARLNMCPRNVQKILKKIYGLTFSEKITEIRLDKAVKSILRTERSLSDIAKESGYNQYASFRRAFIKRFGMSPTEYRELEKRKSNNA